MADIEKWVTHNPKRRSGCWKGHDNEDGVQRAIKYAAQYGQPLTVWMRDDSNPHATGALYEIPRTNWARIFDA
ncbi:hypothetical protein [Streptomyces sp. NPDC097610]|uniref:hypothetical protein n=1 Tax=Streptomyces sp. NPDC097610 TaxID=3157227 RepID=UPI003318CB98